MGRQHSKSGRRSAAQYATSRFARLARRARVSPQAGGADPRQTALQSLIGVIPLRVVMTDSEMRILAASQMSSVRLAEKDPDFLGRSLFDVDPEYFLPFRALTERCLAGESFSLPRLRAPQIDGGDGWVRAEINPWRNASGEIGGLITISLDITDMMRALEASERSEQRLQMALEIAEVHIWEIDFVNKTMARAGAAQEIFFDGSLSEAEMTANTSITIHPDDRERIDGPWRAAILADEPYRPEYRINRADGKEVWAASTVKILRDETGKPTSLVGAMHNITERRRVEADLVKAKDEAEAANRAKSAFLATMSHEIRTPLNGVLGMAQAMAADDLPAVQRTRLDTIRQSGESLLVVLNDILDLSKIEAGKLELELGDFEVSHLVGTTYDAFAAVAAGRGLDFTVTIDDDARGRYRGDSGRLRQILYNLLSNALKFTQSGEVKLHVTRRGGNLMLTVADTGMGIPADRIAQLFNKFEQADASTTRRFGGTGLGLAICRDLATLMGGDIDATSELDVGSRFSLIVPLVWVGAEAAVEQPPETAPNLDDSVVMRVLAAEDNSVNQLVLRTLLQQVGLDPHIVSDGAEAVAAWRTQTWDVILMDVQMPVMDGPSATRAIRAAELASGRPRTPILALTANAMAHQRDEYVAAGMDGVIPKPIRVEQLFAALQAILDGDGVSVAA